MTDHFATMMDQATSHARTAFRQGRYVSPEYAHSNLARRAAVANFETALEAVQVAHMFAFTRITGEYWSGGKVDAA